MRIRKHHTFFSDQLRKYIDQKLYQLKSSEKLFSLINAIETDSLRQWDKVAVSYLSPNEALALGLLLTYRYQDILQEKNDLFQKVTSYFYLALELDEKVDKNLRPLTLSCLATLFFGKALREPTRQKQKKILYIVRHYLEESLELTNRSEQREINFIFLALTEVCLGNLYQGIKNLHKAAKIAKHAAPLWRILANIYKNLGHYKLKLFFENRAKKAEEENLSLLAA